MMSQPDRAEPGRPRARYEIGLASPADGPEILGILEENALDGPVSLIYTRRPDPIASFEREGRRVGVVTGRDTRDGRMLAMGAYAIRDVYINEKREAVAYLFGMRSRPQAVRHAPVVHRGYDFLRAQCESVGVRCYLTTILEGNTHAQRLLEKPRRFMPLYDHIGGYEVFALRPRGCMPRRWAFRPAGRGDAYRLAAFLNDHGRRYQFFPVIDAGEFERGSHLLPSVNDFYMVCDRQGEIVAAGAAWDQRAHKQYVVQRYGGVLKLLRPASFLFPLVGVPSLPPPGASLDFVTLSFWAVKDDDPAIFLALLDGVAAQTQGYRFISVGVHPSHPLRNTIAARPHVVYRSRIYLVDWEKTGVARETVCNERVPYLECGTL